MPSTKLKTLYLLDVFHRLTDQEHRLSVPELMAELAERGVMTERKSVYRDIETFVEYGLDVKKSAAGYYLDSRRFELSELRLLVSAVQAAFFISEKRSRELIRKLIENASDYQGKVLLAQANIGGVKREDDAVFHTIETVNAAIASGRQINFYYYKRDISKRNVVQRRGRRYHASPYAMMWVQDKYYLVCNMQGRDNLTHFRLDRMQMVVLENAPARPFSEVSEYTGVFDTADYAAKCLNMFGGEIARITLRCHNDLVGEVLERFGEQTPLRREGDTHFVTSVEAAVSLGLIGWVSQFGVNMEILSPEPLRRQMAERLAQAAALYV